MDHFLWEYVFTKPLQFHINAHFQTQLSAISVILQVCIVISLDTTDVLELEVLGRLKTQLPVSKNINFKLWSALEIRREEKSRRDKSATIYLLGERSGL